MFQCRTRLFMWCNIIICATQLNSLVSMPHAAFYVVQLNIVMGEVTVRIVSMPHAAFYVVQLRHAHPSSHVG